MGQILKFEEIKKNQHVLYSESYEVKFWIKKGEFWEQKKELYFGKTKSEHTHVFKRWKSDYRSEDVKFISVNYQ